MAAKKKAATKAAPKNNLEKAQAALKLGAASADVLAKRARIDSRAMSKALSALKRKGLAHFKRSRDGENVHRAGKARG